MSIRKKFAEMRHICTIDVHAHYGTGLPIYSVSSTYSVSVEEIIKVMEENEIDQAVLSPIPGYIIPEGLKSTQLINDYIANIVKSHPDRFPSGLGTVDPRQGEYILEEVNRVIDKLKLKGLSWHHLFHGVPIDYPIMFPIMEKLAKKKAIVMIHTSPDNDLEAPIRLEVLVECFPEITFINAHPAMAPAQQLASVKMAKRFNNVYLDTCIVRPHARALERMIKEAGADRVMFGSDLGYYDTCVDLFQIMTAKISYEEKEMVLWKNAAKVFNIK